MKTASLQCKRLKVSLDLPEDAEYDGGYYDFVDIENMLDEIEAD